MQYLCYGEKFYRKVGLTQKLKILMTRMTTLCVTYSEGCPAIKRFKMLKWVNAEEQLEVTDSSIIDNINTPTQYESVKDDKAKLYR